MSPISLLIVIAVYFGSLIVVSSLSAKGATNATFFVGDRSSNWYLVAFSMIGASLSGVTFISVPGWFGTSGFSYMQMVLGYLLGYFVVAFVLLPIYYKHNLSSIYTYLGERFGRLTHITGASFFLFSRILGASFRLFLVADVLHYFVFAAWNIPFWLTVALTLLLIWTYTNKGGIKTVIWTDAIQTVFMLGSLILAIYAISSQLDGSFQIGKQGMGIVDWFVVKDPNAGDFWWKHILGGMFVTIAMTGMDQDMMQRNLSCKSTKDAQKNLVVLGFVLIGVNFIFLVLGMYLYAYVNAHSDLFAAFMSMDESVRADRIFPLIAFKSDLGGAFGIMFIVGLIAAAYSSADSALTSLTTSASIDLWRVDRMNDEQKATTIRKRIHVVMTLLLFCVILCISFFKEGNVISAIFSAANYTYGPLMGLFFFGILTKRRLNDQWAWLVCVLVPATLFLMKMYEQNLFGNYHFGFELLGINGILCFLGLWCLSQPNKISKIQE
jgi:SSS family transporter